MKCFLFAHFVTVIQLIMLCPPGVNNLIKYSLLALLFFLCFPFLSWVLKDLCPPVLIKWMKILYLSRTFLEHSNQHSTLTSTWDTVHLFLFTTFLYLMTTTNGTETWRKKSYLLCFVHKLPSWMAATLPCSVSVNKNLWEVVWLINNSNRIKE